MRERKTFVVVISQSFQSILREFSVLFRRVGVANLMLSLLRPFNIQGREPY